MENNPVEPNEAVKDLTARLKKSWQRGKAARLDTGKLLLQLQYEAEYGTWQEILAELGIPRSTAHDYVTEAEKEMQMSGIRTLRGRPVKVLEEGESLCKVNYEGDPEHKAFSIPATDLDQVGVPPPPPKPEEPSVKGPAIKCTAEQKEAFKAALKNEKERVHDIFFRAFLEAIGEEERAAAA